MVLYQHHVLLARPRGARDLAREVLEAGGERVFGVFTSQIGLSANHVVVIVAAADETAARASDLTAGAEVDRQEIWQADPRPVEGETLPETDGVFSHRWFDIADADWPRFRELSITAWDNFEDVHDTRVVGFWRSLAPPAPGLTRVWLMAWYKNLAAWEGSRWYLNGDRADAAQAYANFRARHELTLDTAVSLLRRVT
ncbi:MAG: hypothetical protein ACREEB_13785 [Caulobacteraceae bacterium]